MEASDFRVFHFPERNPILIAQRTLHDLVEFVWLAVRYQILLKDYAPLHSSLYFSQIVLNRQAKMHQFDGLELPASADFHVHLRESDVMEAVTPTIRQGGVDMVYARRAPPPITTVDHALSYQKRLQALMPDVTFLMSLYLHPTITPSTIKEVKPLASKASSPIQQA